MINLLATSSIINKYLGEGQQTLCSQPLDHNQSISRQNGDVVVSPINEVVVFTCKPAHAYKYVRITQTYSYITRYGDT